MRHKKNRKKYNYVICPRMDYDINYIIIASLFYLLALLVFLFICVCVCGRRCSPSLLLCLICLFFVFVSFVVFVSSVLSLWFCLFASCFFGSCFFSLCVSFLPVFGLLCRFCLALLLSAFLYLYLISRDISV